jgi:uroporphyrinogen III methyltransferase / synthase
MIATNPRALEGRRIVITRAPEQAEDLVRRLTDLGAEVLPLPMVRFVEPRDSADLDRAIAALNDFNWVIFTSANAVRFFLRRCRTLGFPFEAGDTGLRPRIAVVGSATRDALEIQGLRATLVPRQSSGAGLITELANEISGEKVLLPRSDLASAELPAALRAAGAVVTEAVAYLTLDPESPDSAASFDFYVIATLRKGDAAVITFFSPSAFRNFSKAMGDDAVRAIAARVAFAALGPVTAAAIREAGFSVALEATEPTTESLVAALVRHFASPAAAKAAADAPGNADSAPENATEDAPDNAPAKLPEEGRLP